MDSDLSLDDMILSAYRLSWPAPVAQKPHAPMRRLLRTLERFRRERLEGWPVALSAPSCP